MKDHDKNKTEAEIIDDQKERYRIRRQRNERSRLIKKRILALGMTAIIAVAGFNIKDAVAKKHDKDDKPPSATTGEVIGTETTDKSIDNPFNYSQELWDGIEKYSKEYDLPVEFTTAVIQQESHGDTTLKSTDGYNSFGATQPSLNYHFSEFAPALEEAGLLEELTNKPANELSYEDNSNMLHKFQELSEDEKIYQDIVAVFNDVDVNLDVGFSYLRKMLNKVQDDFPDITKQEQLSLALMNYNGGPNAANDYMAGKETAASKNYTQYERLVMSYYDEIITMSNLE